MILVDGPNESLLLDRSERDMRTKIPNGGVLREMKIGAHVTFDVLAGPKRLVNANSTSPKPRVVDTVDSFDVLETVYVGRAIRSFPSTVKATTPFTGDSHRGCPWNEESAQQMSLLAVISCKVN
jgi:hypothetical protein